MNKQVKSKQRVADYGEVFTSPDIVNAMLDQVKQETERIDSRFLEPACGTGNFLIEILYRKLDVVEKSYHRSQLEFERNLVLAISSIYGIDILEDNVNACREQLFDLAKERYKALFKKKTKEACRRSLKYILEKNIIWGDALDLKTVGPETHQIIFAEWSFPLHNSLIKRRDFVFAELLPGDSSNQFDLFSKNVHISDLVDFEDANEVFPGVDIAGGICYFLWERDSKGLCKVVNIHGGVQTTSTRSLNEFKTFIRHSKAVPIIRKVLAKHEKTMNELVSASKPFGLRTYVRPQKKGDLILRWQKDEGPYNSKDIIVGVEMINKWKVITSYVGYDHAGNPGKDGKRRVLSKIDILPPGTICTETYLVIGSFKNKSEAQNLVVYMQTKFFRFLVAQFMFSHHITKDSYSFVPILDMIIKWTDKMLCERYGITKEEFEFMESKIRPMGEENDE